MEISIYLSTEQAERLLLIYDRVNDPDIISVEDYAGQLFNSLLSRIWEDVRTEIMN